MEALTRTELPELFAYLDADAADSLLSQVDHFTQNEAEHREEIVRGDFGRRGVDPIAKVVADEILSGAEAARGAAE